MLFRSQDMRGVWVSSVFNLDFPSKQGLSENELKQEIESIILTAKSSGLTDIFFQVRPTCDALYKSSIFPQSIYLTGTQGVYAENSFDPLGYFIQLGKESNT